MRDSQSDADSNSYNVRCNSGDAECSASFIPTPSHQEMAKKFTVRLYDRRSIRRESIPHFPLQSQQSVDGSFACFKFDKPTRHAALRHTNKTNRTRKTPAEDTGQTRSRRVIWKEFIICSWVTNVLEQDEQTVFPNTIHLGGVVRP